MEIILKKSFQQSDTVTVYINIKKRDRLQIPSVLFFALSVYAQAHKQKVGKPIALAAVFLNHEENAISC